MDPNLTTGRPAGLPKTGGWKKGTPNRRTQDVIDRLAKLKCDAIEGMAKIALDKDAPLKIRAQMFKELAQYVAPKKKAIEHSGGENAVPVKFVISG